MNRAVKIRIYPIKGAFKEKTIGCSRFIYNQMLADKISYYQKENRNTPAGYKNRNIPGEVDSLALANAQLHLESAFRKFFREPSCGFPRYKSRKYSRNSYTTNAVTGNILLQDTHLKLPKMSAIKIKLHRQIPSEELEIITLENAVYLAMKNDLAYVFHDELFLYEQQSSKNKNMPLRCLFYVSDSYSRMVRNENLYGSRQIQIPGTDLCCFL
ncbi:MAG: transposase [Lachnospiraceae bacterium]